MTVLEGVPGVRTSTLVYWIHANSVSFMAEGEGSHTTGFESELKGSTEELRPQNYYQDLSLNLTLFPNP